MTPEQLEISLNLINQKVQFSAGSRQQPAITIDYKPPIGDGQGYMPLELLLMSLASCSGSTIITLLRKMKKSVSSFEVRAQGVRRGQHPTAFEKIFLHFTLNSADAQDRDMMDAIRLSEESYCPVWAMLKNNVEVIPEYQISPIFSD